METSHSPVLIQHLQETIHSHHFPPGHTPYSLHKNSALLSTIFNKRYLENNANLTDTLRGRIGKVVASHAGGCKNESRLWLSCTDLCYARGAQGVLLMRVGSAASQLDLPSLTPLSEAGCGRLQLGAPHWATSVDCCE